MYRYEYIDGDYCILPTIQEGRDTIISTEFQARTITAALNFYEQHQATRPPQAESHTEYTCYICDHTGLDVHHSPKGVDLCTNWDACEARCQAREF